MITSQSRIPPDDNGVNRYLTGHVPNNLIGSVAWDEGGIQQLLMEYSCFVSDLSAVAELIGIWGGRHGLRRDRIKASASAGAHESID